MSTNTTCTTSTGMQRGPLLAVTRTPIGTNP